MNVISSTKPSLRDLWRTPRWLVFQIEDMLKVKFILDPCVNDDYVSRGWFSIDEKKDGLKTNWADFIYESYPEFVYNPAAFVNPPFSNLDAWIDKVIEESKKGLIIAFLHPNNSDTKWCRKIEENCFMQLIPNSRINFIDPETGKEKSGVNFHSVISIFNAMPRESVQRIRFDLNKPVKRAIA